MQTLPSRRSFVRGCLAASGVVAVTLLSNARAADAPMVRQEDPAARKLKYTENASTAPESAGHKCADCALYEGKYGSSQGPCQLFAGSQVKAAGWCTSWAPQM